MLHSLLILVLTTGSCLAFTPPQHRPAVAHGAASSNHHHHHPSSQLHLTEAELTSESLYARGEFVIWFFGASGAAGIARSAFPQMFDKFVSLQQLKDVGPTLGGEKLGINPLLCFIPQDLAKADVLEISNNKMSIPEMVEKFPVTGTYLASRGYLTFEAFEKANAGSNPLAVRSVFDTFASGAGCIDPRVAERKLESYRNDVDTFSFDLMKSKFVGLAAIVTLLGLLGVADIIAFGDLYHGWFPDWPGGTNFPFSMVTQPNGSPFSIPQYWI